MIETVSQMLPLGTKAPAFAWPDTTGKMVSMVDFSKAPALLVIFMCNHCPYVKHILKTMVELIKEYQAKGVMVVGINANDVANLPDDRPELMAKIARQAGFTFAYLYDHSQEVAKAYHAVCTPEFFLFDKERLLVYRGQMDDSRPGNNVLVTGTDLKAAIDAVLQGRQVSPEQKPSIGCNIKWKQGNEPEYAKIARSDQTVVFKGHSL